MRETARLPSGRVATGYGEIHYRHNGGGQFCRPLPISGYRPCSGGAPVAPSDLMRVNDLSRNPNRLT